MRTFWRFPLTWLVLGVVVVLVITLGTSVAFGDEGLMATVVAPLLSTVLTLAAYWALMRWVADRRTPELRLQRVLPDAVIGVLTGVVFMAAAVGVLLLVGVYRFDPDHAAAGAFSPVPILATSLGVAVFEEVLFRGLLFQAVERLGGRWVALVTTTLLFGLAHLLGAGSTIMSAIAVSLEAGVLFGAIFLWRRTLWSVIAVHFTLNAAEELLGLPGSEGHGLVTISSEGAELLTGGPAGFAESIVAVIVGLVLSAIVLTLVVRRSTSHGRSRTLRSSPSL